MKHKLGKNSAGSVMAELAMVLPFLGLMFYGVSELGYKLSQLTWMNSSLCQAVEVGTSSDAPYSSLTVEHAFNQLYSIQDNAMSKEVSPSVSASYQPADSTLRVAVTSEVQKVFGMLNPSLKTNCNAGYFAESPTAIGSYDTFLNESNVWWYGCNGARNYSPPPDGVNVQAQPCADAKAPPEYTSNPAVGPGFGAAG